MKQQLQEAILAGERALESLREAERKLDSAEGWGLFDLLGGGFLSGMIKRSRMKAASSVLEDVRRDLRAFQRELLDVQIIDDLQLDAGGFLSFTDIVFDDFISDFLMQRRINKAQEQLRRAQRQVSSIVNALRDRYAQL